MGVDGSKEEEFLYLLTEGSDLLRAGNVANARDYFERALLLEPGNEQALNLLGLALHRLEHFKEAEDIFRDLIHNNPVEPSLRLNLAMVLLKRSDLEGARRELEVVIDLNPDHPRAASYMGLVHERREAFASAALWYERAGNLKRAMQMRVRAEAALQGELVEKPGADPSFLDGAAVVEGETERSTPSRGQTFEDLPATQNVEVDSEPPMAIADEVASAPPPPPSAESIGLELTADTENMSMPAVDADLVLDLDQGDDRGEESQAQSLALVADSDDIASFAHDDDDDFASPTQEFTVEAIRQASIAASKHKAEREGSDAPDDAGDSAMALEETPADAVVEESNAPRSDAFQEDIVTTNGVSDSAEPAAAAEEDAAETVGIREGDALDEAANGIGHQASESNGEHAPHDDEDVARNNQDGPLTGGAEAAALTAARADAMRRPNARPDEGSAQQARSASLGFTLDVETGKRSKPSGQHEMETPDAPRGARSIQVFAAENDAAEGAQRLHRRGDGAMVVPIDEVAYLRSDLLVSLSGQFEIEPLNRRYRGRRTDSLFGGNQAPMVAVMGRGVAVFDPAKMDVAVLELANEELYLVEGALASFSAGLVWENGRLPSEGGPDLDIVHLRGTGAVVLGSPKRVYAHTVLADAPVTLHVERLVGWNGQVVPYRGDLPGLPESADKPPIVRFEGTGLVFGT